MLNIGTNKKLGPGIGNWSREVGPTCPTSCPFLLYNKASDVPPKNRCYAGFTQVMRPTVRKSWQRNLQPDWSRLVEEVTAAWRAGTLLAVRIHVGGDFFGPDNRLDVIYTEGCLDAFRRIRREGCAVPAWFYIHVWREMGPYLSAFRSLGVEAFASVHDAAECEEAARLGWRLAIDPGNGPSSRELPPWVVSHGARALVCPELRRGVTCDRCGFCWRPSPKAGAHVQFCRH